ncbi:MAG: glycoside hydrolase family 127 protein, partial [Candidatus Symbiothrix sp.]|nr:glycoside hydrolase family 127 protein [Candidatus Symbiothrix sp.]
MKYTILILSFLISAPSFAQTFAVKGHTRGSVQWQSSPDAIHWTNMEGAVHDEMTGMDMESGLFYRVKIEDGSCEPIYSQTYKTGDASLTQISFEKVELTDQFWSKRMQTQKERLVPIAFNRTESAVEDLRRTANYLKGNTSQLPSTSRFVISDLFKVMEGAAYLLSLERDAKLEKQMDDIAVIIAGAQESDGYLYPAHTTGVSKNADQWGGGGMGDKPYSWVVHSHELYDVGHLYEAAVAYYRATGKTNLLKVAEKSAKHVNQVFFEGDPKYNNGRPVNQAPGHEEIELALVKLYQATNNSL